MTRYILIVEDNDIERELLADILRSDYEVITVPDVIGMLSVLLEKAEYISAIMLDLLMPEIDGFEALRRIRENQIYRQIPVIAATSLHDEESQVKAMSLGANGYVFKPFNRELLKYTLANAITLREKSALINTLNKDSLTGVLNRKSFFETVTAMVKQEKPGYYILSSFDIENFKVINDQYGIKTGDEVLKGISSLLSEAMEKLGGVCCRYMADKFGVLYPAEYRNSKQLSDLHKKVIESERLGRKIRIRIGRYLVDDTEVPVSAMYDRATLAEESIRGRYDAYIAEYSESMRVKLLNEQKIVNDMSAALKNGEFQPWLQPQYNHATGAVIGAEALVRWNKGGKFISPAEFVPIFERNGFIYEMDQYIWEQICILLRRWLDEEKNPLPVSINISRRDLFHQHFIPTLTGIVKKYNIPYSLIRLEVTESAFAEASGQIVAKVGELISLGFIVEIDDFGSGYSSLNTLKDVPAAILKLDMKFFENTANQQRGGNIIESVVRMAKWLGMAVIAEGVEEKEQADYLKSIGCYYIQGYYYAKPMPVAEYEKLLNGAKKEPELSRLETLKSLDNNEFWNPKSMETLIFNSYVGGACIFEFMNGKTELLRVSEQYARELGGLIGDGADLASSSIVRFLDDKNKAKLLAIILKAIETEKETSCEICLHGEHTEFVRVTLRQIASAAERSLFYGVIINVSERRKAEQEALYASERVKAVMDNSQCGITAVVVNGDGKVEYLFVNHRFFDLLGYTEEQFEAEVSDPYGCIAAEDYEKTVEASRLLKQAGQSLTLIMKAVRRDKKQIYLRADISMVTFADVPKPVQLSNFLDITEQVEMEKKQLENAKQLEVIMNNVNGGVSALQIFEDGSSSFVFNNDKYYELYGYTEEQVKAEKLDVMKTILPEDLPSVMEKVNRLKRDGVPSIIDYRCVKRDGRIAYLRANSSLMHMDGYGGVITSVVTDITEQRELSDKFKAVIDNINGGVSAIHLIEGKPKFVIVNERYFDIIGYTKEQFEAEVEDVFELICPEDRERVKREFAKGAECGGQYTMEYRFIRRDGAVRSILCNTNVIRLFGVDEPVQLAVSNDITDLRAAQQKEHEAADKLSLVLNHAGNGITALALRGVTPEFVFANDRYFEMIGYTREDYAKATEDDIFATVFEDDREGLRKTIAALNGERGTNSVAYRLIRPDGKMIWIRAVISITSLSGIDVPVEIGVFSDITAEKEAIGQLKFLNDSAHDILAQPDSDVAINKTLENLLTYFNGDRAYVIEIDREQKTSSNTYEKCAAGIESEMEMLQKLPFADSDYWYVTLSRNEFVVVDDTEKLSGDCSELRSLLQKQHIRSIIVAPLWRDGVLMGFSGVDNPRNAIDQLERLKALADYIAILLTRRDLNRKIKRDNYEMQTLMNDTPGGFIRMEIRPGKPPEVFGMNNGLCRMLGVTREEFAAEYSGDAFGCVHRVDREAALKAYSDALASGGRFSCKCRLRRKDRSYLWVMAFCRFVKDEAGLMFLNAYFTDISEQKNAEEQQKELLDNLPCGAALYEYDGKNISVIHINKSYWELVERAPVDYSAASVMGVIHPEDKNSIYQEIESAIRQKRNFSVNIRILCGTASYKPFRIDAKITPEPDGKYLFFASYTPISEQAMSIQEMLPIALSTMMSASEDLSYVKDKDLHYICCSRSVTELLGLDSERDVIGKTDYELFEKKLADSFVRRDKTIIERGEAVVNTTEQVPSRDGGVRLANTSKYPLTDASGNVIGLYGISRDITAQRQKESQLELLTSSIPGGLAAYFINSSGIEIIYFNDGFYKFSGYSREEYSRMVKDDPLCFVFDEDKDRIREMIRGFEKNKIDGHVNGCIYRCHTKDGGYSWMSLRTVLSRVSDEQYVVNAVQLDITEQQEEKERLRMSEELNALAIKQSGRIITRFDVAERTLTLPDSFNPIFVLPHVLENMPEEQIGLGRVSPDTADVYTELFESIIRGKPSGKATYKQNSSKGWRWLEAQFTTVFYGDGKPVSAVISFTDVTEELEKELVYNKWQQSLNERPEDSYALFRCNLSKGTSYDSWEGKLITAKLSGKEKTFDEITDEYVEQCVYFEDRKKYLDFVNSDTLLAQYYRGQRTIVLEYREAFGDRSARWLKLTVDLVEYPGSKDVEVYLMYENIDEQKKADLLTLVRSQTDPLTGIYNRAAFIDKMERILSKSAEGRKHALLMLDVDNFKRVNDTLGHGAGDQVLINLTAQVGSVLRRDDLLGRMGGDEFFVFLKNIPDEKAAASKAKRICGLDIAPKDADFPVTISMGIAMSPKNGDDFDTLYKKVDAALYQQKEHGKNGFKFADKP